MLLTKAKELKKEEKAIASEMPAPSAVAASSGEVALATGRSDVQATKAQNKAAALKMTATKRATKAAAQEKAQVERETKRKEKADEAEANIMSKAQETRERALERAEETKARAVERAEEKEKAAKAKAKQIKENTMTRKRKASVLTERQTPSPPIVAREDAAGIQSEPVASETQVTAAVSKEDEMDMNSPKMVALFANIDARRASR